MPLTKRRNKLLTYFVIFSVHIFLLCHYSVNVEGNSSSQHVSGGKVNDLTGLFSEVSPQFRSIVDIEEGEEYYYEEDYDPYGIGDGDKSNENLNDDDYSYDNYEENDFSSKSGKILIITRINYF